VKALFCMTEINYFFKFSLQKKTGIPLFPPLLTLFGPFRLADYSKVITSYRLATFTIE